jgi:hypothetical protein
MVIFGQVSRDCGSEFSHNAGLEENVLNGSGQHDAGRNCGNSLGEVRVQLFKRSQAGSR